MQDELLETVAEAPQEAPQENATEAEAQLEPVEGHPEVQIKTNTEQVQVPAVQILVKRDEHGNIDCDVVATGDVRATEVETLIKMGLNKWRGKIGLLG